jgi:hypothetical protein
LAHDVEIIAVQAKKLVHKPLISRLLTQSALTVQRALEDSQPIVFIETLAVLAVFGNPASGKFPKNREGLAGEIGGGRSLP